MKEQSVLFNFIQFVRFVNAGTSLRVASGLEADASGPEAAVPGLTIPILLITKDSECIQHPVLIPLPVAVLVPAFIRIVGYTLDTTQHGFQRSVLLQRVGEKCCTGEGLLAARILH